jgi:hypothetical protein
MMTLRYSTEIASIKDLIETLSKKGLIVTLSMKDYCDTHCK